MRLLLTTALLVTALGCGGPPNPPSVAAPLGTETLPPDAHSHERGKTSLADFGPHHALLTAHLSKAGHELDIFVETADAAAKPFALPAQLLTGSVQVRRADGVVRAVEFTPAPADERPAGEAAGACSHFVAKVPWLEPDAEHRVIVEAVLNGKTVSARWNGFVPKKFAHHED